MQKISNDSPEGFRGTLSGDEINRLLNVAPAHRATVDQTILYTGPRMQMSGLRWGDFDFTTFKRDLTAAGIAFEDERGRCADLQALRTTYGTLLSRPAKFRQA